MDLKVVDAAYLLNTEAGRITLARGGSLLLAASVHMITPVQPVVTGKRTQITQ